MFYKKLLVCTILFSGIISLPAYPAEPQKDWVQITTNDLHRIHDTLVENTPQYIDKFKPFMTWLDKGLNKSLLLAQKSNTEAGYYYSLAYYTRGFHNGHIRVETVNAKVPYKYAELFLQYKNGKYKVKYRSDRNYDDLPPLNSQLISCNGKSAKNIVDHDIIPYQFIPALEASYGKSASYLFLDANPFRKYPRECVFKINGAKKKYSIHWRQISFTKAIKMKELFHKNYNFQILRFGHNGLWISIPTLDPQNDSERDFLELIVKIVPYCRSFDPIVIDVRGNHGGNSAWAAKILAGLYGEALVKSRISTKEGDEIIRVSKNNIDNIKHAHPDAEYFFNVMRFAQYDGLNMVRISEKSEQEKNGYEILSPMFNNHLYFLTDNNCFSSCLIFADYVHWLPNTTHIGATTNADSPYIFNNEEVLSGGAHLVYTMVIYRNRIRGDNQPYIPKYSYDGDISNTKSLMQWVQKLYATHQN